MSKINSFGDAEKALKAIEDKIASFGKYTGQLADFNGRRLSNVSPSVDPTDVVVRSELLQLTAAAPPVQQDPGDSFRRGVFGVGVNSDIVVANDISTRHLVVAPFSGPAGKQATLRYLFYFITQPPIGSSLKFQLVRNFTKTDETLIKEVEVLEGVESDYITSFDSSNLSHRDNIACHITEVGSVVPGSNLAIVFVYEW